MNKSDLMLELILQMLCDASKKAPPELRNKWFINYPFDGYMSVCFINEEGRVFIHWDDLWGYVGPDEIPFNEKITRVGY